MGVELKLEVGAFVDILAPDGSLYLRRYCLEERMDGGKTFLHYIYQSDQDRDAHDHPWDFTSRIVSGSYIEHTPIFRDPVSQYEGTLEGHRKLNRGFHAAELEIIGWSEQRYKEGDLNVKSSSDLHRVSLFECERVISLVYVGPKKKPWHFFVEGQGLVHNENYLDERYGKDRPKVAID